VFKTFHSDVLSLCSLHIITGCHRVLLARSVLGLEEAITVDVLFPNRSTDEDVRGPNLWMFAPDGAQTKNGRWTHFPECPADTVNGKTFVKEVYEISGLDDQNQCPFCLIKRPGLSSIMNRRKSCG
jgi:glutathionyl-hydroquinone reductase